MKQSILYALTAALLTAGLIKAAPAYGQSPSTGETYVSLVPTADLNLKSSAGQRRLEQRLSVAARAVCGTASDADLEGKNAIRKCRTEAMERAFSQRDRLLAAAARGELIAVTATR